MYFCPAGEELHRYIMTFPECSAWHSPGSTAHFSDTEFLSELWHFISLLNFCSDLVAKLLTLICSETANLNLLS